MDYSLFEFSLLPRVDVLEPHPQSLNDGGSSRNEMVVNDNVIRRESDSPGSQRTDPQCLILDLAEVAAEGEDMRTSQPLKLSLLQDA